MVGEQDSPRIAAMREFAERQGFVLSTWTGNQREPGDGVAIRLGDNPRAMSLRVESQDGLDVAVARMEQALLKLANTSRDVYLVERPADWGQV